MLAARGEVILYIYKYKSDLCHIRLNLSRMNESHMGGTQDAQAQLEMKLREKRSAEVADLEMQVTSNVNK